MKKIAVINGDGIGEEVTSAAMRVMRRAAGKCGINLEYEYCVAGGAAIDRYGVPLPPETLTAVRKADAVLLGAVGGPKWDDIAPNMKPEQAILGLRKELGLYANLRPVRVPAGLEAASPLKREQVAGVDIMIVRELNGGIYYGEKCEAEFINGVEQAWDVEKYSVPEIQRILRIACLIASKRRQKVTSVDKANVLASSRLWRKSLGEIAGEYQAITIGSMYVDACAMQLVLSPKTFDVIVTSNLFGDILSDEAAVITGSIGMLPSASLGAGQGLYEPIHGSAPDIAGQGIANPLGTILSAALLFTHSLRELQAAGMIEQAVDKVLADGYRTKDMYEAGLTLVSTEEMGRLVESLIA